MNLSPAPHRCLLFASLPLFAAASCVAMPAAAPTMTPSYGQSPAPRSLFGGTVADPTGAIVPGAQVQLLRPDKSVAAKATTDSAGHFQLPQPTPGDYRLTITLPGFSTLARPLHVTASPLPTLALTLNLADVSTSVDVSADQDTPLTDPANNADAATVSADDMKSLPVFDGDIVSTLSAFLNADAAGEGGATLIVDGIETNALGVAPSAIERVSINQDPYSAEYRNPGSGQIEIVTKSAQEHFHGAFSFTFRDSSLNAANYFSATKPRQQRRLYEGYLTGPFARVPKTSFLFSATRKESDYQVPVDATVVPVASPAQNVPDPGRNTSLTFKLAHDFSDHHSGFLLYRFFDNSSVNNGVGGHVQQTAGYASYNFDMDLTYHDDLTLGASRYNQFNLRFERNADRTVSADASPQIVVEGVATFGGAQNDTLQTENNPNLSDIFTWTLPTHTPQELKFGVQVPNLGRRILEDDTDRQGTYIFSSAAAFAAGTPASFSIQQGQSRFETLYAQPGAFVMDQIQLTPRLTVVPGLRYDFQNTIAGTKDGFSPHLSFAYVVDKKHGLVVRTGSAVYIRRVGVNIGQQVARYSNAAERSLLITSNLCYPIAACNPLAAQPPSLFNLAPGMQSPVQAYYGLSVERQVTKNSTVTLGYTGYRGWHALRSIDVNAPLPPFTSATRPDPNYAQELMLDSGGYQKTDEMTLSYRGRIGHVFGGYLQYNWQHADADAQWSTFIPQNQFAPNDEWSRTDNDQRQRFNFFGTLYPEKPFTLGIGFYNNTPTPYNITTGTDDYHTGLFNARPAGVARNSVEGGSYQDLQVRLGYTHKLRPLYKGEADPNAPPSKDSPTAIAFSLSSFNTLNRPNFQGYDGVVSSAQFMQPTTAADPRRLELTASYNF